MAVIKRRPDRGSVASRNVRLAKPSSSVTAEAILKSAAANGIRTVPLDIDKLVQAYGVSLKRRPLEDDISGHLKAGDTGWIITVNSLHHPRRQRFTLAHELGHFILHSGGDHRDFVDKALFRSDQTSPEETEANRFAAGLLMPSEEFKRFAKDQSSKVEDIAEYFGVSALAVRVRAKELGFKGHGLN
ncbi:MAG: ImmA/IrrE family metallo-endopeptidase [Aquisalimonadaceae bacterium]